LLHAAARRRAPSPLFSLVAAGALDVGLGSWATRYWLAGALNRPTRTVAPQTVTVPPVTIVTHSGVRIYGIQRGHVAIKRPHARVNGPAALRLLAIITVFLPTHDPLALQRLADGTTVTV
jgi:ABC-type nitrate/sulfonate/bicarbonate transport system substrate-binding protein